MSENPRGREIDKTAEDETLASEALGKEFLSLTESEEAMLSKVLFPDTHTAELQLLGVTRQVRPLPVKYAKQLFSMLLPFSEKVQTALQEASDGESVSRNLNDDVIGSLFQVAELLGKFYGWDDVVEAVKEEEISIPDLQSLAVRQQEVNGHNDFLLGPLRVCIRVMQIYEITQLKFHSLFTTRELQRSGTVPSTS